MPIHYASMGLGWSLSGWTGPTPDRVLYTCVLTGAADSLPDVTLPISKLYARLYSADPSEHQVSVPYTPERAEAIQARPNGTLRIFRTTSNVANGQGGERMVFEFPLENYSYHRGAYSATYVLTGSRQSTNWTPATVAVDRIIDEGVDFNGQRTWTVPADYSVQPGDSITIAAETILIDRVQFHAAPPISGGNAAACYLVLREAQPA